MQWQKNKKVKCRKKLSYLDNTISQKIDVLNEKTDVLSVIYLCISYTVILLD